MAKTKRVAETSLAEAGPESLPEGVVIRRRKLADYMPDPRNANKGTERGLYMLERSLAETGAGRSIVAAADDTLPAGNKTLERAIDAGYDDVVEVETNGRVIVVHKRSDWASVDDEQARLYAYYDNRTSEVGLEWDPAQLAEDLRAGLDLSAMWRAEELDELLAGVKPPPFGALDDQGAVEPDDALLNKWGVERGQVWEIPSLALAGQAHRLMCGDATSAADVRRLLAGERADCVFTSPPYAVGVDYGAYQDTLDNLRAMLPALARLWREALAPGGFAVINFGDIVAGREAANATEPCEYPMALEYWPVFRAEGWRLWSRRIWCKSRPRVHSPWCMSSNRAASDFEHIWTWRAPGPDLLGRVDGLYPSDQGWIDTDHQIEPVERKSVHGAAMPASIARHMLAVHSRAGAAVFEPFCGTGTTLIAAEELGRRCLALELSPAFVALALERFARAGLAPRRAAERDG